MEIQNARTTPSKSNKLKNVGTVRWESRNITTHPGENDSRKSEVIAFVVNASMQIIANNFYILNLGIQRSFFVWSICFVQLKFRWIYIRNMILKCMLLWWLICAILSFCLFAKTTRKNEINEAIISAANYFAPLFILFQHCNLSSFRHEITIIFVISLFRAKRRNNEKTETCVFSTLPRNNKLSSIRYFGAKRRQKRRKIASFRVFDFAPKYR